MNEHQDTNCGVGMYRDTPEEKEIARLSDLLNRRTNALDDAVKERDEYARDLQMAREVASEMNLEKEKRIERLRFCLQNVRAWIMANTRTNAHDILKTIDSNLP